MFCTRFRKTLAMHKMLNLLISDTKLEQSKLQQRQYYCTKVNTPRWKTCKLN